MPAGSVPLKTDKSELLALIVRGSESPTHAAAAKMRARIETHSAFDVWLKELERHLPPPSDPELDGYYRDALMGLVVGFGDRNLSPYLEAHTAIIAPMLADIRAVFEQIKTGGQPYSVDEFTFRAFDYGIHKAYYLDWDLYLSHDMY